MQGWSLLFAIGASQAALLALALWRRKINPAANHVLAAWTTLVCIDLVVKALYFNAPGPDFYTAYRFVALFPFLYGSFFYVYVRALTQARGVAGRDVVHLAGFMFALAAKAEVLLRNRDETAAFLARLADGQPIANQPWYDVVLFGYSLSYIAAALVQVHRYRRRLLAHRSDADRSSLRWIDAMAVSQIAIWCIAALHWLARIPWINYPVIFGGVVLWVFLVGYLSLSQAAVPVEAPDEAAPSEPPPTDDARFPAVESRLAQLMAQEALYREPALTIGQLAKRSGYPEYLVSAVINRRFDGNFWEYVNRLRIEAVRERLADPAETRTILDIAYDCGFTSKSTFNAAFKRQLGQTPSDWRRQHAATTRTAPG